MSTLTRILGNITEVVKISSEEDLQAFADSEGGMITTAEEDERGGDDEQIDAEDKGTSTAEEKEGRTEDKLEETSRNKTPPREEICRQSIPEHSKHDDFKNSQKKHEDSGVKRRREEEKEEEDDFKTPSKKKKTSEDIKRRALMFANISQSVKKRGRCTEMTAEEEDTLTKKRKTTVVEDNLLSEMKELLSDGPGWCLVCAKAPCLCMLTKVEMKIDMLNRVKEGQRQDNDTPPPDVVVKTGTKPKTTKNVTKRKITKMKEEEIIEMRKTTKDLPKMFQDKLDKQQKCGPKTTSSLAATTTSTAARRPTEPKVSPVTTNTNCVKLKKMCARYSCAELNQDIIMYYNHCIL